MRLIAVGIVGFLAALASLAANAAEEETFEVYTTPKGTYRLETAGGDETQVFVVLKSSGQRERLPDASSEDPTECRVIYAGSPDENWIFRTEGWRHHGVQDRQLYNHENGVKFVYYKGKEWFAKTIVAYAIKAGGFRKTDFYEQRGKDVFEDHLNANFRDWSPDSARLLLSIMSEYSETAPRRWYVYFNTRTNRFELTPYLRALNKMTAKDDTENATPCAEPIDALPSEAELKTRAEKTDQELKEWFANREAHPKQNETAEYWQDTERLDQGARRRTKVILAVCARERSGKAATAISRRRCCGQACISRSWLGVLKRRELQAATNWPYPRRQLPRQTLDFSLAFLRRIRHQPIPYERSSPILHHVCRLRSRSFRK